MAAGRTAKRPTLVECHFKTYYYNNEESGESTWKYPESEVVNKNSTTVVSPPPPPSAPKKQTSPSPPPLPPPPPSETDDSIPSPPPPPDEPMAPPPLPEEPEPPPRVEVPLPPPEPKSTAAGISICDRTIDADDEATTEASTADPYRLAVERKVRAGVVPPGMEEDVDDDFDEDVDDITPIGTPSRPHEADDAAASSSAPIEVPSIVAAPSITVASQPAVVNAPPVPPPADTKPKTKVKRTKRTVKTGIPSKKLKKVSSLVHKWQSLHQQQQEMEEMEAEGTGDSDADDNESPAVVEKRIDEWKRKQLEQGNLSHNPNFQQVSGDWRERVRKAKQQRSQGSD